jgi:hypothetical protein
MLFDVTLRELQRRNEEAAASYYDIHLAQCSTLLRPMQTMRLVYQDAESGLDVDTDLNILEATWSVDVTGVQTTSVIVSNVDRWPQSDVDAIVNSMTQGHVYQALPQLNANSYVTAYTKNLDKTPTQDNYAQFRFRFGEEVVQLQQVLFEFQLLPFESTVRAVGGSTSGSGDIPTSEPSVNDTGVGGNDETGSGGGGDTSETTPTLFTSTPTLFTSTPTLFTSTPTLFTSTPTLFTSTPTLFTSTPTLFTSTPTLFTVTPTLSTVTPTLFTSTPTLFTVTPTLSTVTPTLSTVTLTTTASSLTTSEVGLTTQTPLSGDTTVDGRHTHAVTIGTGTGNQGNVTLQDYGSGIYGLLNASIPGGRDIFTLDSGNHTHDIGNHTHGVDPHSHTIAEHDHDIQPHDHTMLGHNHTMLGHSHTMLGHDHTMLGHDHTMLGHNHTMLGHSHTMLGHDHTMLGHSHTMLGHNHTMLGHDHTMLGHSHTMLGHTHTMLGHTHSMSNHTHSLNNHTHDLSESIAAIYGIFREVAGNTYGIADLEYRINSLAWQNLSTATSLPGDWYELDLTSQLVSTSIIGRPNQANNVLEIRATTPGKTVTVDAQLTVRNIIQAIAYA